MGLVSGQSEELRAAVGRRLAGMERHSSQVALGDGEDSPLQSSKRSSTFYTALHIGLEAFAASLGYFLSTK